MFTPPTFEAPPRASQAVSTFSTNTPSTTMANNVSSANVPASAMTDDTMILYAGHSGTKYYASFNALVSESGYFKGRLSGDLDPITRNDDGVRHCMVHVDAEVFPLLLRYIETGFMPLLWDVNTKRFDGPTYARMLQQAHFLSMKDAIKWLEAAGWERAVTIERSAKIIQQPWNHSPGYHNDVLDSSGAEVVETQSSWVSERHYPCPSGNHANRANRTPCDEPTCKHVRGKRKSKFEIVTRPKVIKVSEKIIYNMKALNPNWDGKEEDLVTEETQQWGGGSW